MSIIARLVERSGESNTGNKYVIQRISISSGECSFEYPDALGLLGEGNGGQVAPPLTGRLR